MTSRRSREARRQHRLARLRLEPERVAEIQRALTQAGYLNQVPTGRWDEPTRQAMRRYQGEHGFSTTGLPEAKSLMKLGLGPHPLPPELDLTAAPQASMDSGGNPRPSIDQPNSQGSPSPGSSPENNL